MQKVWCPYPSCNRPKTGSDMQFRCLTLGKSKGNHESADKTITTDIPSYKKKFKTRDNPPPPKKTKQMLDCVPEYLKIDLCKLKKTFFHLIYPTSAMITNMIDWLIDWLIDWCVGTMSAIYRPSMKGKKPNFIIMNKWNLEKYCIIEKYFPSVFMFNVCLFHALKLC